MPPEIPELPPSANAAPMAKPSLMLWRVSPIMIIQATADIFFSGFLIPSSSLNTERRDKLCLRLFLGLSEASWGSASPLTSPFAFCLKEKSILCTCIKYISAWFFSAMSSVSNYQLDIRTVRLHFQIFWAGANCIISHECNSITKLLHPTKFPWLKGTSIYQPECPLCQCSTQLQLHEVTGNYVL